MSSVHDTITETIRDNLDLNDNITGDQTFEGAIDPDELAAEIIAALESRGFVVRKQVEPEAAKNDASALVAAWNAGFIEGRRP